MNLRIMLLATFLVAGWAAISSAAAIFSDDFESYADTAAMQAVWGNTGAGTLATATGNPGQSMQHPAGVANEHAITGTPATDASPIIWQFDFLDDGAGNKRITGALRDVNGSATGNNAFFEMGRFNSVNDPETNTTVSGYAIRTVFVGGPSAASGWITYVGNPGVQQGWHRFKATIGATSATFDLDFGANGSVDATRTVTLTAGAGKLYNLLRLGGPSNNTSAGGGAHFDNLSIIPEPMSITLAGLIGIALLGIRRRKN